MVANVVVDHVEVAVMRPSVRFFIVYHVVREVFGALEGKTSDMWTANRTSTQDEHLFIKKMKPKSIGFRIKITRDTLVKMEGPRIVI